MMHLKDACLYTFQFVNIYSQLLFRNGSIHSLNVVGLEMQIRKPFLLEFAYTPELIGEC